MNNSIKFTLGLVLVVIGGLLGHYAFKSTKTCGLTALQIGATTTPISLTSPLVIDGGNNTSFNIGCNIK